MYYLVAINNVRASADIFRRVMLNSKQHVDEKNSTLEQLEESRSYLADVKEIVDGSKQAVKSVVPEEPRPQTQTQASSRPAVP